MTQLDTEIVYQEGRQFISLAGAAKRLGLHPFDIYDAAKYGGFPVVRFSSREYIAVDDLERLKGAK
jgi:hypothetical protein